MINKHNELSPQLERYLALCKRTYEDMERNGTWPWAKQTDNPDSQDSEDMVDSGNNPENL